MRTISKDAPLTTGHKGFDSQSDYIGTGNISSNTQFSNYIRAYDTATTPVGQACKLGAMRAFDLKSFREMGLPRQVEHAVLDATQDSPAILYQFMHRDQGRRVVHGYVLTRTDAEQHELLAAWATGPTAKSRDIIDTITAYVSTPPGTHARFLTHLLPALSGEAAREATRHRLTGEAMSTLCRMIAHGNVGEDGWRIWGQIAEGTAKYGYRTESLPVLDAAQAFLRDLEGRDGHGQTLADTVRGLMRGIENFAKKRLAEAGYGDLASARQVVLDVIERIADNRLDLDADGPRR